MTDPHIPRGGGAQRHGDRWPTHKAKARARRHAKPRKAKS